MFQETQKAESEINEAVQRIALDSLLRTEHVTTEIPHPLHALRLHRREQLRPQRLFGPEVRKGKLINWGSHNLTGRHHKLNL